jgi:phage-related protein
MHDVVFYRTQAGSEVVLDLIRGLDTEDRKIVGEDLRAVQSGFPMGLPLCRSLGGGLWEVRSSLASKREMRLVFFHDSGRKALVVVHAFIKKSQKTPDADLALARRRTNEFKP